MKKVVFAALVVAMGMGFGTGNAFAENGLAAGSKSLGITAGSDTLITGKLGLAQDMAVLVGFGLSNSSAKVVGIVDKGTTLQLAGAVRKYLKVADFAPFAEGGLQITSNTGGATERTGFGLFANVGAEYFFNKQFSVEGSAGVSLSSDSYKDTTPGGSTTSVTTLSTQRGAVGFNFYF